MPQCPSASLSRRACSVLFCSALLVNVKGFFLHSYVDRGLDFSIREQNMVDRLFRAPPTGLGDTNSPTVLLPDAGFFTVLADYNFTSCIFLGHDFDVFLFSALTYAVSDLWFDSAACSILITYLCWKLLVLTRSFFGERNLSNRTLVDDRFLI